MKASFRRLLSGWIVGALCTLPPSAMGQEGSRGASPPALVNAEVLETKVADAEANPDLDAQARSKLVALYREALSNLKAAATDREKGAAFEDAARAGPERTARIRERSAATRDRDRPGSPDPSHDMPRAQLELRLNQAQADLAAAEARRADFERQSTYHESRPPAIRQRLTVAQDEQESLAVSLLETPSADEGASFAQARRWALETRYVALSAEITALNQELQSLPARLALLSAERDAEAAKAHLLRAQADALRTLVNSKREKEAETARHSAQRMLQEVATLHPLLMRLAEENAQLGDALYAVAAELDALDERQALAEALSRRIEADHSREEAVAKVSGLAAGLGQLLLERRAALPNLKQHAQRAHALEQRIAAVGVSRLRHLDELERFDDVDKAAAELAANLPFDQTPQLRLRLRELVAQRQALLHQQLEAESDYLDRALRLQAAEDRVHKAAEAYDEFLKTHLFWLRTGPRADWRIVGNVRGEMLRLTSPTLWFDLGRVFHGQVATSPAFWVTLVVTAALLWKRRALARALRATSAHAGKPATDRFASTLFALMLSLVASAPLPLLLGVSGWLFAAGDQGTELSHAVGLTLIRVALMLYVLLVLRVTCIPGGLAITHFRWPETEVRRLSSELRWFTPVFVTAMLVARVAVDLNTLTAGGVVTRVGVLVATLGAALFFYRILHPRRGVLAHLRQRPEPGLLLRTQALWFPVLTGFPLVLLVAALDGYVYTTLIMASAYVFTLWLIVALVLVHALAVRWLTLARRRLSLRAALERRAARIPADPEQADTGAAVAPVEYAEVDLEAVSTDSRRLLGAAITLVALAGLYLIWSSVFPALGILDEVTLWHHTETVNGEERTLPVSLADVGLALVYVLVTIMLAKHLPAVLDTILLARFQAGSGSRYTATTLTTYAIVTAGTLLALNTIGAQWSQLQWLVAALGVGIGFGLQEIVANFISGLIILFERPVRVGDMVTVGDTDGVVTKIRIRATTIRNLDRKELLVPNKEFITGRLLNWSLSDQVMRVMVVVGVAYGTDVEKAHALMREAAEEHQHVLKDPKPVLSFEGFGDNSLTLILRAFIDDLDYRIATITDLHKAINRKFEQAGIVIAFPQRDLHLDAREPLRVTIEDSRTPRPDKRGAEPTGEAT